MPRRPESPTPPGAPSTTDNPLTTCGFTDNRCYSRLSFARTKTVDSAVIQRETSAFAHQRPGGPVRTCVGCRKRELAVELLRVVAVGGNGEGAVTVDPARKLPGRGAWLHPEQECLDAAIRRRAFARALRITGSPDITAVVEYVSAASSAEVPDTPGERQVAKNMSTP
jgi:uncharacterized protein